ncbi:MAG TPA: hypothetical protein IAC50_01815 [Candidatus Copromorpha excrementigallinarum]|uniref:Uncharacterized protein n=1 Tax=Candidatus Allocopromorpha excrementigallinarum TaxID=2840742 RepID=A0A9D1L5S7_9FIRM|nr:hypothetical protein [Candidatus Copromorpha excrementigallinarum]
MAKLSMFDQMKIFAAKQVLSYVDSDPENNLPRLISMIQGSDAGEKAGIPGMEKIKERLGNRDSGWYRLLLSLWTDVDKSVRNRIFENIIAKAGPKKEGEPWSLLEYDRQGYGWEPSAEEKQADSSVILLADCRGSSERLQELLKTCESRRDMIFAPVLEPHQTDEAVCESMLKAGNSVPVLWLGREEEEQEEAFARLRKSRLLFGAMKRYGEDTAEEVSGGDFADKICSAGAKALWLEACEREEREWRRAVRERTISCINEKPLIIFETGSFL